MNQNVYQIERGGKITTVKATDWGSAVVGLYPDLRPISWNVVETHSITKAAKTVIVNGNVSVREIDISPACV